ncbi:TaqI-like C-terminal specificity domain-containing protein [Sphingobacterium spiritivorum]|uniref:TaqI-like C-terminal specificity domain-containing protein n=1 Tax=Sphingobacterium spiritivorum TaxID=258 RepID=UPI001C49ADD7
MIRPILRGRDIKRYSYDFSDLWLINTHNGIKEKGIKPINIDDYPAIKNHLDNYYPKLAKRADKGETPYNLRNCAYMEDFYKQKIIYPEITKYLNFYLDNDGFCTNNKCFIMSGEKLNFLTAFFNSSLFKFCYRDNFPELLGGTRELRKVFLEQIPVVKVSDSTNTEFEKIGQKIQTLLAKQVSIREFELKIDKMIFDLYSLTDEERNVVGFIEIE